MFGTFLFKVHYIYIYILSKHFYGSMTHQLLLYSDKLKPKKASWHFFTFIRKLFAPQQTKQVQGRIKSFWCHPLLSLLWLWMLSPLMFGHNVSSVHYCHTRPAQLLRGHICIKLSNKGAVIRRHAAPRPVIWDPGVGQTLPHDRAVACRRKRHKEKGRRVDVNKKVNRRIILYSDLSSFKKTGKWTWAQLCIKSISTALKRSFSNAASF